MKHEEMKEDEFDENECEWDETESEDDQEDYSVDDPGLDAETINKYNEELKAELAALSSKNSVSEDYSTSSGPSFGDLLKNIAISFVKNFFGCK